MKQQREHELAARLEAMTRPSNDPPELWRLALERGRGDGEDPEEQARVRWSFARWRVAAWWRRPAIRLALAACLTLVAAVAILLIVVDGIGFEDDRTPQLPALVMRPSLAQQSDDGFAPPNGGATFDSLGVAAGGGRGIGGSGGLVGAADVPDEPMQVAALDQERLVVRRAEIELVVEDVRATFLRASRLTSAAHGEFVEQSTLQGEGDDARADLVLRVRSDRLGEVLNALRELGRVRAEQSGGEDVTDQVVDLEARLHNERRVEQEMLELLESRADADLDDILHLRRTLASTRESIERLVARRDRLAQLVELASVLVVIRPEPPKIEDKKEARLGEHFREQMGEAWESGARYLADSVAWVVEVMIGGLIWWILLLLLVGWLAGRVRRATARLSEA